MIKSILIVLFVATGLSGCTKNSGNQEGVGGSNTGMGTVDQTGTGYTTDSPAGQKAESAAKNPSEEDRRQADQSAKNNEKSDPSARTETK